MKRICFFAALLLVVLRGFTQPSLVSTAVYGKVSEMTFDTLTDKLYVNFLHGCTTWNIPCAYSFSLFSQHNLVNKHSFSDVTLSSVEEAGYHVPAPSFPVNNYNSAVARNSVVSNGRLFTNLGYHFNRRDTSLSVTNPVWTYSPATNPSYKEISVFEVMGDSVLLFEKDSTSGTNYYTVILKNAVNGSTIPYNSVDAGSPMSLLGSINGHIRKSTRIGDKILLAGTFTASVLGSFLGRNIIAFNINTGALESVPLSFPAGSHIYDLETYRGKIWVCGRFQTVNGLPRKNFAVVKNDFTLDTQTLDFTGFNNPSGIFVDAIEWYHDHLIAKGYFAIINGQQLALTNNYWVKAVNITDGQVMPWNFSLPGAPLVSDYLFRMYKHRLYIKNKTNSSSPFHIYCFEPVQLHPQIMHNNVPVANFTLCSPGTTIFKAPFKYAQNYAWSYSGAGLTIQNIGGGEQASIASSSTATSGTLSVTAYNDCGLASATATVFVTIVPKPDILPLANNLQIFCNPDSTLLSGSTTNTSSAISWRRSDLGVYNPQPFYTKLPGNYFMVVKDTVSGCSDSSNVTVTENKVYPNAKLFSHVITGVTIPIDTLTCFQPSVSVTGGSDTLGTLVTWRHLQNDSLYANPLISGIAGYYRLIVTRMPNGCADSTLIVLVGENKQVPQVNIAVPPQTLNCSKYSTVISAAFSPAQCSAEWFGPNGYEGANPLTVSAGGMYKVKITNPVNGCVQYDSAQVYTTNVLELGSSQDTMVCRFSPVPLHTSVTGTLTNIFVSWNGVQGGSTHTVFPAQSTAYVVSASSGTCIGSDTVFVKVPSDVSDSVVTFKSCSDPTSGTIVVFASGGRAPYEYSINGGASFHATGIFSNQTFGNYTIVVRDSMQCVGQSTAELTAFSNLPEPEWLSSSYNNKGDTLILVDISIPKADSVQWIFPTQVIKAGGDMFNPLVTMADTGSVKIIMRAFYADCIINSEKWIHFGEIDSTTANSFNDHGIQSFIIYPNPNSGLFNAEIMFTKRQNVVLQVWDNNVNKYYQQNYYNVLQVNTQIDVQSLINGSYYLRVTSEYDSEVKSFIINK